jgi:hypothetical protein
MHVPTRRHFFGLAMSALAAPFATRGSGCKHGHAIVRGPHPDPRPGITAAKVPARGALPDKPEVIAAFDQVREIPGVIDGIRCRCGCADYKAYHSLLSCFEVPDVMARDCEICQTHARLAYRLHKAGRSLDEIRKGIDARFA